MPLAISANTRRSERVQARFPVTLLVDSRDRNSKHDAWTVDLSQVGASIRTGAVLVPGQILEVNLSKAMRCAARSRVIWVGSPASDRFDQAGLEFIAPLPTPI